MNPAAWGGLCALSWGAADFVARFTGRGVGVLAALFGVLCAGSVILSLWVWLGGVALIWPAGALWLLGANGVAVVLATLLLYAGLARGPISVVSPIVGSYPAIVLAYAVAAGTRPSPMQWLAMAATMAGVVMVARLAPPEAGDGSTDRTALRRTVLVSLASAVGFAVALITVQRAVPVFGNLQTLWAGRLVSLAMLLLLFAARRRAETPPLRWWPLVGAQGLLDAGGYAFLYEGSAGDGSELAAVASSAFGAVTTVLACAFLRERIGLAQGAGIVLIFAGVAVLSS
jgi:drug/metabolite transporter (DMT)-like permease